MPLSRTSSRELRFTWTFRMLDAPLRRTEQTRLAHDLLKLLLQERGAAATIRSRTQSGLGRRPLAFDHQNRLIRQRLSVSHLPNVIAVAASHSRVGIDLVDLSSSLPPSFQRTWFTSTERERIGGQAVALYWAAKEASYKAMGRREPFLPAAWLIEEVDARNNRCIVRRDTCSASIRSARRIDDWCCTVMFSMLPNSSIGVAFALSNLPNHLPEVSLQSSIPSPSFI